MRVSSLRARARVLERSPVARVRAMIMVEILAGAILFALASYAFWRIGDEAAISPRWRSFPGLPSIAVLVVLGGWSAGASFLIHAFVALIAS